MSGDGRLLRVGEAAEILGVDARQVYEALDARDLPARHIEGHGIRLARDDVEAYAAAIEVVSFTGRMSSASGHATAITAILDSGPSTLPPTEHA